jgi:hypothetical protein
VPRGDGNFVADVDAAVGVSVGDTVRVHDPTWPTSSHGMIVGVIRDLERIDEQPLSRRVVVVPIYQLKQLSQVTLKIEEPLDEFAFEDPANNGGIDP